MANPFQRYQSGGFETVPGIAQAGANIGQMLGAGFSNFGSSIASGLKQYYENTAKSKAADEDIAVVGQQLMARQNAYIEASGADPELLHRYLTDDMVEENGDRAAFAELEKNPMVRYAKQLQPVLDSLRDSPNKGLSQKLSALNSAKASSGMLDEQMKLDEFIAKHRLENVNNKLPTSVQVTEDVVTPNALVDPNNPFFKNVKNVKESLEQAYPDNPEFVKRGVQQYIDKVKAKYEASDMSEEQKFEFASALERYAFGEVTDVGEETGFGKVSREARASYEQSMADAKAQEESASANPESDALKRMAASAAENINAKRQAEAESKKKVASAKEEVRQAVLNIVSNGKVPNHANFVEEKQKIYKKMGLVWDGDSFVDKDGKNMDWVNEALNNEYLTLLDAMDMGSLKGLTNPAREKEMVKALKENPEFQTRVIGAIPQSKARSEKLAEEGKKLAETKPTTAEEVLAQAEAKAAPKTPAVKSKPFSVGELELGSRLVDQELSSAEREAAAREFYAKKFGSVPVGFTQMYRQMYPEAAVRTTEVNGVPVIVDGKGNITVLKGDSPSVKDMAEAKALTFKNTEIAPGVVLDGIFGGTVAGAQDFRKNYAHMANVRSAIDELIKINDMGWESMSPTARARAEQLQNVIIAALRIPIVGPGAISEAEQAILQRIVEKGTGIFTLEASERAALRGLKDRVDAEMVNWPKSMGLNVRVVGQDSETIKAVRMRRLRSERNIKTNE